VQAAQCRVKSGTDAGSDFDTSEFLQFLGSYKIPDTLQAIVGGKRKALMLYRAFIDGQNFPTWRDRLLNRA
jgi:hypothetical protein